MMEISDIAVYAVIAFCILVFVVNFLPKKRRWGENK